MILKNASSQASNQDTSEIEVTDSTELKRMYTVLLQENRKMKRQIGRINTIYSGIQAMCETINLPKVESHLQEPEGEQEPNDVQEQSNTTEKKGDSNWIDLIAISSSGNNSSTTVSVTFRTSDPFYDEWTVVYNYTRGILRQHGELSSYGDVYNSSLLIDLPGVIVTMIWIHSKSRPESLFVSLPSDVLGQAKFSHFDRVTNPAVAVKLDRSYETVEGQNLTISVPVLVNGNILNKSAEMKIGVFSEYTYINTSSEPHRFETVYQEQSKMLNAYVTGMNDDFVNDRIEKNRNPNAHLIINIHNELLRYGGMLLVSLLPTESDQFYQVSFSYTVNIFQPGGASSIPNGSLALKKENEKYLAIKHTSVRCSAIGNPPPTLKMFKVRQKGQSHKPIKTETFKNGYLVTEVNNFVNKKPSVVRGTYICRATNGIKTAESNSTVDAFQKAVIKKAQLKKDTSEEIVVACKASGNPLPDLKFLTWTPYGEDLRYRFQVTQKEWGRYGKKIKMSIPGNDTSLSEVVCVADQGGYYGRTDRAITIREYIPENIESAFNASYYDMYL